MGVRRKKLKPTVAALPSRKNQSPATTNMAKHQKTSNVQASLPPKAAGGMPTGEEETFDYQLCHGSAMLILLEQVGFKLTNKTYRHDDMDKCFWSLSALRAHLVLYGIPNIDSKETTLTTEEKERLEKWVASIHVPNRLTVKTDFPDTKVFPDSVIRNLLPKMGFFFGTIPGVNKRQQLTHFAPGARQLKGGLVHGTHYFNSLNDLRVYIRSHEILEVYRTRVHITIAESDELAKTKYYVRLWAAACPRRLPKFRKPTERGQLPAAALKPVPAETPVFTDTCTSDSALTVGTSNSDQLLSVASKPTPRTSSVANVNTNAASGLTSADTASVPRETTVSAARPALQQPVQLQGPLKGGPTGRLHGSPTAIERGCSEEDRKPAAVDSRNKSPETKTMAGCGNVTNPKEDSGWQGCDKTSVQDTEENETDEDLALEYQELWYAIRLEEELRDNHRNSLGLEPSIESYLPSKIPPEDIEQAVDRLEQSLVELKMEVRVLSEWQGFDKTSGQDTEENETDEDLALKYQELWYAIRLGEELRDNNRKRLGLGPSRESYLPSKTPPEDIERAVNRLEQSLVELKMEVRVSCKRRRIDR